MEVMVKVQVAPYHAKQALREETDVVLPKLNFDVRWVVSTKSWPFYRCERHRVPIL
jgi:hypothetical protein